MRPFLSARWHDLIAVNYEVQAEVLEPYLPYRTELDLWEGKVLLSLVAFRFINTRVRGFPIPCHQNFEEVNLRFYVKCDEGGEKKRGVVFIKELVPKRAIALVANRVYGENYACLPMSHVIRQDQGGRVLNYGWRLGSSDNFVSAELSGVPQDLETNSEAEFIFEHYWGYTRRSEFQTSEYQVEHPRWRVWRSAKVSVGVDFASTYGVEWASAINSKWRSAFVAEGSEVLVYPGRKLNEH